MIKQDKKKTFNIKDLRDLEPVAKMIIDEDDYGNYYNELIGFFNGETYSSKEGLGRAYDFIKNIDSNMMDYIFNKVKIETKKDMWKYIYSYNKKEPGLIYNNPSDYGSLLLPVIKNEKDLLYAINKLVLAYIKKSGNTSLDDRIIPYFISLLAETKMPQYNTIDIISRKYKDIQDIRYVSSAILDICEKIASSVELDDNLNSEQINKFLYNSGYYTICFDEERLYQKGDIYNHICGEKRLLNERYVQISILRGYFMAVLLLNKYKDPYERLILAKELVQNKSNCLDYLTKLNIGNINDENNLASITKYMKDYNEMAKPFYKVYSSEKR
ncbi:MAG: hypothetical protein WDA21_05630 [Bacilli bacterium]